MRIEKLNLVEKDGTTSTVSVELSDKADASKYFGTWYKANVTAADVVGWAKERIAIYQNYIENLKTVMSQSQLEMVGGMSDEQLEQILAARKANTNAPVANA